jgi:hypothetical protein
MKEYTVAVAGALGVVGQEMILTLERRKFPVKVLKPLDIPENAGREVLFRGTKSQGAGVLPGGVPGRGHRPFRGGRQGQPRSWRRRR